MRILILSSGNSCSKMVEGYLKLLDKNLDVYSAGTKPAEISN